MSGLKDFNQVSGFQIILHASPGLTTNAFLGFYTQKNSVCQTPAKPAHCSYLLTISGFQVRFGVEKVFLMYENH